MSMLHGVINISMPMMNIIIIPEMRKQNRMAKKHLRFEVTAWRRYGGRRHAVEINILFHPYISKAV